MCRRTPWTYRVYFRVAVRGAELYFGCLWCSYLGTSPTNLSALEPDTGVCRNSFDTNGHLICAERRVALMHETEWLPGEVPPALRDYPQLCRHDFPQIFHARDPRSRLQNAGDINTNMTTVILTAPGSLLSPHKHKEGRLFA